jgi:hypothetical protein
MIYFDNNIETLLKSNPDIGYEQLNKIVPAAEVEVIQTPSGFPTALYKGNYIHSKHDPRKEAERIITSHVPPNVSICIFYGFGLGYLPESFRNHFPDTPCLIIEPDLSFFLKVLHFRDIRHLLTCKNMMFLLGSPPEQVIGILEQSNLSCVHLVKLRSVFEKNLDYYNYVDNILEFYLKKREINKNTLKRFGKLWIKNLCSNIKMIAKAPGINNLADLFKGYPALVVAAGPSLEIFLPYLKQLSERMVVIAVDTSLLICQKYGVDPDFVIVADPQYWNTRHLDYVKPGNFILISESATHPRVFRLLKCPIFMGSSLFPFGKYLESITGQKGKLGAGGSVATSAWDFARLIGANPIFLAGLDLGFPKLNTHFKGSFFEENFHNICFRFKSSEGMSFSYLHNAGPIKTKTNNNSQIITDQRMLLYKFWFETQAKLHPQVKTENLSLQGIKIEGMPYQDFQELLVFKKIRPLLAKKLTKIKNKQNLIKNDKLAKIIDALNNLIKELESLNILAAKGLHYSELFEKRIRTGQEIDDLISCFSDIDKELLNKGSKTVVGFLLQPLINEIMDTEFRNTDPKLILQYSKKLYSEIISSSQYHLEILKKTLILL